MSDEQTRGGWADKLRAMSGDGPAPSDNRLPEWAVLPGYMLSTSPKMPFDLFSRMTTRGQAGVMSPVDEEIMRRVRRDYVPDGLANAFNTALEYAGHMGAAIPAGTFARAGQMPQALRNERPITSVAGLNRDRADLQAWHAANEAERLSRSRGQGLGSEIEIIRREVAPATSEMPQPSTIPRALPPGLIPERRLPPGTPRTPGAEPTAENAFSRNPGPQSPSYVVPPPPGVALPAAVRELIRRARGEALFGADLGVPQGRSMSLLNELAQQYGVAPIDLARAVSKEAGNGTVVRMPTPPPSIGVLPEPKPLTAYQAAGGAKQPRLPGLPDEKELFWANLQRILNNGSSVSGVSAADIARLVGLKKGEAASRLQRAGNTGLDGPDLADMIKRGIESGNWKLAVPAAVGAGNAFDQPDY